MSDFTRVDPLHVFNFGVTFTEVVGGVDVVLCTGAFSEVTGLEATMEPKVIKEGGRNYGVVQRVGPVTFATVVLKRGISQTADLWKWFDLVAGGSYVSRLTATVTMKNPQRKPLYQWQLLRALPTKFKTADLSATGSAIGIEELHIAHEGMERVQL